MNPARAQFERCPACGIPAAAATTLFTATLFERPCNVRKCRGCGLIFKEWFQTAEDVSLLYGADYVHFVAPTIGPAEVNGAREKLARCRRHLGAPPDARLRLLDVGCGAGGFVQIARQLGCEAEGIDPHLPRESETAILRRAVPEDLEPSSFDIVVLLNVAEHVPQPKPFFTSIRRLLRPDGVMLLNCPYGDSLARRLYRERWTHLALDEHVLFWTPRSLLAVLGPLGFEGESSHRIAGSPFPFGRTSLPLSEERASEAECASTVAERPRANLQSRVWQVARRIQGKETLANAVRFLVDVTATGDYLEFAITTRRRELGQAAS